MPERSAVEIEKFLPGNQGQLDFMKTNVREFYDPASLSWQYSQEEKSTGGLYFSKDGTTYIASQGMISMDITVDGKSISSAKSESSFLLPSYRGRGIFEDLYAKVISKCESDGIQLFWGFTELSNVWRNKLDFTVYDGIVHESVLQLSLRRAMASALKKGSLKAVIKACYAAFRTAGRKKPATAYAVKSLDFSQSTDQQLILNLYARWQENHRNNIILTPDKEFFDWRICRNPVINYHFLCVYHQSVPAAVTIISDSGHAAYLADFVVIDEKQTGACLDALIHEVNQLFNFSQLTYWANAENAYNKSILDHFRSKGAFVYKNNKMNFVLKRSGNAQIDANITNDVSRYCLNGLWTEGFKI